MWYAYRDINIFNTKRSLWYLILVGFLLLLFERLMEANINVIISTLIISKSFIFYCKDQRDFNFNHLCTQCIYLLIQCIINEHLFVNVRDRKVNNHVLEILLIKMHHREQEENRISLNIFSGDTYYDMYLLHNGIVCISTLLEVL